MGGAIAGLHLRSRKISTRDQLSLKPPGHLLIRFSRGVLVEAAVNMDVATIAADCNPGENNVVFSLRNHGYDDVQRKRLPLGDFQISY